MFRTFAGTVVATCLTATTAQATPLTLTQQGRVLDVDGVPLNGSHTVDISLFPDELPTTSSMWDEQYSISFSDGYYAVELGTDSLNPLSVSDFADEVYYSISVDGASDTPRVELTSVPFAIRAEAASVADALAPGATVDWSAITNAPDVSSNSAPAHVGAVYRWARFASYDQTNWMHGNTTDMFGGVAPSNWTDGNALASSMSSNMEVLRSLFTRKGYGGLNANVYTGVFNQYSSTNGQVVVALFRIRNTTASPITWTPVFNYTCYGGWSERASVALNGVSEWQSGSENCVQPSVRSEAISIPANKTSTVIFVSTSSQASNLTSGIYARSVTLAFRSNSLGLPSGLEYVDDLDTATALME